MKRQRCRVTMDLLSSRLGCESSAVCESFVPARVQERPPDHQQLQQQQNEAGVFSRNYSQVNSQFETRIFSLENQYCLHRPKFHNQSRDNLPRAIASYRDLRNLRLQSSHCRFSGPQRSPHCAPKRQPVRQVVVKNMVHCRIGQLSLYLI